MKVCCQTETILVVNLSNRNPVCKKSPKSLVFNSFLVLFMLFTQENVGVF